MGRKAKNATRSVSESLREYQRGVAGGFLFSLPLLFTMEVWWSGFIVPPLRVLTALLLTFVLLLGYNRCAGLRHDANWVEVVIDSVEELGLGLVLAALFLWLIGQITGEMSASEIVGKVAIEAMIVAIGVSVGTAQLRGDRTDEKDTGAGRHSRTSRSRKQAAEGNIQLGGQMVIAFCGAVIVGGNVAPTEEILVIASEISSWKLLGLALSSISLGLLILFYSDIRGAKEFVSKDHFLDVVSGAAITYAVALLACTMILWFFGRFDGVSLSIGVGQIVVLGVAGVLGASAGRLLLQ